MKRMARWTSLFSLLVLAVAHTAAAEGRDPYQYFFHETWNDFQEELENARAEGKKGILFFFEMDECPFCHRMKKTVLNQPEVQAYFRKHFRLFAVDIEGDIEVVDMQGNSTTQKDFALKSNRVRATPVFAFYDLEGKRIARYTGATNTVEEFLWLGEYVTSGAYREMPFPRYKRQRRAEKNKTS